MSAEGEMNTEAEMNTEMEEGQEVALEFSLGSWVLRGEVPGLAHNFSDRTLLRAALIPPLRRSVAEDLTFSRLSILGSMILRFAVLDHLYRRFDDDTAGDLHLRLDDLTSIENQNKAARRLGLEGFLLHGEADTLADSAHIDCYRALAGAVFLDGGEQAAAEFIECSMREDMEQQPLGSPVDAKTRLSDWCASHNLRNPIYEELDWSGSGDEQLVHILVRVEGPPKAEASASGSSLKSAEQSAAANLLERLPPSLPPDAKTQLNAWCDSRGLQRPIYEALDQSGYGDEPMFHVVGRIEGLPEGEARGSGSLHSKAEEMAAEKLLEQLLALSSVPWVLPNEIPHLGFDFRDDTLLRVALIPPVRRSVGQAITFKRLEFLGDHALYLAVLTYLYRQFEDETAGDLGGRLKTLVSNETWRKVALRLGLERFVSYDGGGQPTASELEHKALADCYKALAGAAFLDGGWDVAAEFMECSLQEELENLSPRPPIVNAKTRLSNWCDLHGLRYPVYEVLDQRGPDDEPMFHVVVRIEGPPKEEAEASGSPLRQAADAAAEKLLEKLNASSYPQRARRIVSHSDTHFNAGATDRTKEEGERGRKVAPDRSRGFWVLRDDVTCLGYEFREPLLLRAALIPPDRRSEAEEPVFHRLKSLGGMVFRVALADYLYRRFEDESPGDLSPRLDALASIESQNKGALRLGLERFVFDGGEDTQDDSALAYCYRALAGAVFLDGGVQAVCEFIEFSMREELENPPQCPLAEAKLRLRLWCDSHHLRTPIYEALDQSGPDHEAVFHAAVRVEGAPKAEARASGSTPRKAEQAAAEKLLEQLPPSLPPDAKTRLNAWCNSRALNIPIYEMLYSSDSDDEPMFHVMGCVEVLSQYEAEGSGSSLLEAEQVVAENLLEQLPDIPHKPWVLQGEIPHLGHDFREPSLLHAALIPPARRSVAEALAFQRLESLGDQVLGLAVLAHLYHQFENETAGDLGNRLNVLVSNKNWCKVALRLGLERFVDYDGEGQPTTATSAQKAVVYCYRALAGAVYLDGGWEAAVEFMEFSLREELEQLPPFPPGANAKKRLKLWCGARGLSYPVYEMFARLALESMFHVVVRIKGPPAAEAEARGSSIKMAEEEAAEKLFEKLNADPSGR